MPREYSPFPILAVSATVFNATQAVLLIKRSKAPAKGLWALPGGAVRLGEDPETALKREITEECKLTVTVKRLNRVSSMLFYDKKHHLEYHYVILNYICTPSAAAVQAGSDAEDAKWVSISALRLLNLADGVIDTVRVAQSEQGRPV